MLVAYEPQGNDVDVVLQRWVTSQTDLATGCATRGSSTPDGLTPNVDAQGAVNRAAIAARLPGYYNGTIPSERFGEASLNLSRHLRARIDDPCFSFGQIWLHGRSSESARHRCRTSSGRIPLVVRNCTASGTKFHDLDADGGGTPGEPGLAALPDLGGLRQRRRARRGEPFADTDAKGQYSINDIRPPDGTYTLREKLTSANARRRAARRL